MRPVWAALGIILLMLTGVVFVYASSGYKDTVIKWGLPSDSGEVSFWTEYNTWNVSGVLNKDDIFKVEIYAAQDWTQEMEPTGTYAMPFKPSFVNITDPSGAQTEFEFDFLQLSSDTSKALVFYNVTGTGPNETIEKHGIDTVRFEIPYGSNRPGLVATALSSGTYWVNMTWLYGGGSPPYNMTLSRGTVFTTEVNRSNFYPVGIGVLGVSAVCLVYGFKRPKKTAARRRAVKR